MISTVKYSDYQTAINTLEIQATPTKTISLDFVITTMPTEIGDTVATSEKVKIVVKDTLDPLLPIQIEMEVNKGDLIDLITMFRDMARELPKTILVDPVLETVVDPIVTP